jgi:hypothetical protein
MTIIHFKGALFQIGVNRKDFLFSFKAKDKNVMLYKYNSIPDNNKNNVDRETSTFEVAVSQPVVTDFWIWL